MKKAIYIGTGGLTITGVEEKSQTIEKGHVVNLDEVISDRSGKPRFTLGEAVEAYSHLFELIEDPVPTPSSRRSRKSAETLTEPPTESTAGLQE
jgi:hypothetical protein